MYVKLSAAQRSTPGRFADSECPTAFQNPCRFSKECGFTGIDKGVVDCVDLLPASVGNTAAEASSGNIVTVTNLMVLGVCSKTANSTLDMAIVVKRGRQQQESRLYWN
jgi:hypothetical protein